MGSRLNQGQPALLVSRPLRQHGKTPAQHHDDIQSRVSEQDTLVPDRDEGESAGPARPDSHQVTQGRLVTDFWHANQVATSQHVSANDSFDNNQAAMPLPNPKKLRCMKTLRKKHDDLYAVRENVLVKREEIQSEYQDLSFRLEQFRLSQEEIMNALREELISPQPNRDFDRLNSLWDRVQSDQQSFQDRLERIDQLHHFQIEPEAELIVADAAFLDAAKKTMKSAGVIAKKLEESQQPSSGPVPSAQDFSPDLRPEESALVRNLHTRQADIKMYSERLNELEWDYHEEKFSRELLYDRGDEPEVPKARFDGEYKFFQGSIQHDILQASTDVDKLQIACVSEGLLKPQPPKVVRASMSTSYLANDGGVDANEVEDSSEPSASHAFEQVTVPDAGGEEHESGQGSPVDSVSSSKRNHITDWIEGIEPNEGTSMGTSDQDAGSVAPMADSPTPAASLDQTVSSGSLARVE